LLSEITLLFDLSLDLDRTLAQRKAQRQAKSKVSHPLRHKYTLHNSTSTSKDIYRTGSSGIIVLTSTLTLFAYLPVFRTKQSNSFLLYKDETISLLDCTAMHISHHSLLTYFPT